MESGALRAFLIASLTTAVGLAGCAGTGGPVYETQPEWESGYAWTYLFTSEEKYLEEEDGERYNETESATWRSVHEVLNTTQSADGEGYYVVGVDRSGDYQGRYLSLVRQRDLDDLPYRTSSSNVCLDDQCTSTIELRDINASTPTFLDFPLERGKRWGGVFMPYDDLSVAYQAEVDGSYAVSTGLGTMEAARVSITYQIANLAEIRQQILAEAQAEGYQVDELRLSMSEHHLIYYSDTYQAIVRADARYEESFYARGTDDEGERFVYRGEFEGRNSAVVEGARLLPRPERSMEEVMAFLSGEIDLRDPTGQAVGDASYKLSVSPAKAIVNAGAGQAASFNATIEGDMPDDHTLMWRLVDGDGVAVSSGTGTSFSPTPSRPGAYTVELESKKGNASIALAGASLTADWRTSSTVDCGPVSVTATCVDAAVPVHPGVRSVSIRLTPQGPVPAVSDQVYLTDSAGTRIDATRSGTSWTLDLAPVAGYLVDDDPWTLRFDRSLAALSSADVEVQVMYSGAAAPAMAGERAHVWDAFFG